MAITITYTWEVLENIENNDCMYVSYKANIEGIPEIKVGMPAARVDISLEDHIKSYAPYSAWRQMLYARRWLEKGQKGTDTVSFNFEDDLN